MDVEYCLQRWKEYLYVLNLTKMDAQRIQIKTARIRELSSKSYLLCPGELMAFETEARASMTPEQRQMLPPLSRLGGPYVLPKALGVIKPSSPQPSPRVAFSLADYSAISCAPEQALPDLGPLPPAVCRSNRGLGLPYLPDVCNKLGIVHNPAVAHEQQKLTV